MKPLYLLFFLVFSPLAAWATHIVGGELDLQPVSDGSGATHRVSLNLYFDALNGNPGAEDLTVTISVFRKRDNTRMGDVELGRFDNQFIDYTNPACVTGSGLSTRLIRYSALVTFRSEAFDDPLGYYLVWERCCRNNIINNIVSPQSAGSVFYLEMPPLLSNSRAFRNGSPQFSPIKGDYVCRGESFTFDFSAKDPDGDALSYRMVTPYNGFSNSTTPKPLAVGSSAYPEVRWMGGYSASNAIPGAPALRIDARTGQLTLRAGELGLFVFSVEVTESRGGRVIGLVRRDFQLKVIDCPQNQAPLVQVREAGQTRFYQEGQIIRIARGKEKCLTFLITDPNVSQRESIRIKPVTGTLNYTLLPAEATIRFAGDTIKAQFCLGACAESFDGKPIVFDVICSDNGCPIPRQDTLRMSLLVEPDPNLLPQVSTTLPGNQGVGTVGQAMTFTINGLDPDNDSIRLEARGRGFTLASAGMDFSSAVGRGKLSQPFRWTPRCGAGPYVVDFIVTDLRCNQNRRDSVSVSLSAPLPDNQQPDVSTTLTGNAIEITMDVHTPPIVRFDVLATDPDKTPLSLTGVGRGFSLTDAGMSFTNTNGMPPLTAPFSWTPTCRLLEGEERKTFVIDFIADDAACRNNRYDTVTVRLTLLNRPANYEFKPPNVFTPNADGRNDYYAIDALPVDNCAEQFERIVIYNRWGKEVFSDTSRDFKWYASDFAQGEYFYLIQYTRRKYKGPVTLLK